MNGVAVRALGDRIRSTVKFYTLERLAKYHERHRANTQPFFFVQIGANDGVRADPLNTLLRFNRWTGIMVEPVEYYCEKLRERYSNRREISIVKVAIASVPQKRVLYRIDPKRIDVDYPHLDWLHGQGTFYEEIILGELKKHCPNDFDKVAQAIVTDEVECLTFSELLQRHSVKQVDLLQIDVQGYDYEILNAVDFSKVRPAIISFESEFSQGREACLQRLAEAGYEEFRSSNGDTIVIDSGEIHLRRRRALLQVLRRVKRSIRKIVGTG